MPKSRPGAPIAHVEWSSPDMARLQAFYGDVFGWAFQSAMPDYVLVDMASRRTGGGLFQREGEAGAIVVYFRVSDLAATEARILAAGGTVEISGREVQGMGSFSQFKDPDGNVVALWQEAPEAAATRKAIEKAAKAAKKAEAKAAKKAARAADKAARRTDKAARKAEKKAAKAARKASKECACDAEDAPGEANADANTEAPLVLEDANPEGAPGAADEAADVPAGDKAARRPARKGRPSSAEPAAPAEPEAPAGAPAG